MLTPNQALNFAYSQGTKLALSNAGISAKDLEKQAGLMNFGRRALSGIGRLFGRGRPRGLPLSSVSKDYGSIEELLAKEREAAGKILEPSIESLSSRKIYMDALAKIRASQPRIGAGHAALGGAALGGVAGGLTAEEGQGTRGALQGALIGAGIGGGAGLAGGKLFAAPEKLRANLAAMKALGAPSKAIGRMEAAQKLYKTKALGRHAAQAALGAAGGGIGGYMLGSRLMGSPPPPAAPTSVVDQGPQAFNNYVLPTSMQYPQLPLSTYGY